MKAPVRKSAGSNPADIKLFALSRSCRPWGRLFLVYWGLCRSHAGGVEVVASGQKHATITPYATHSFRVNIHVILYFIRHALRSMFYDGVACNRAGLVVVFLVWYHTIVGSIIWYHTIATTILILTRSFRTITFLQPHIPSFPFYFFLLPNKNT